MPPGLVLDHPTGANDEKWFPVQDAGDAGGAPYKERDLSNGNRFHRSLLGVACLVGETTIDIDPLRAAIRIGWQRISPSD